MTDQTKPIMSILSQQQVFNLAKKYIDEENQDGFHKYFMFITPKMLEMLNQSRISQGKELERDRILKALKNEPVRKTKASGTYEEGWDGGYDDAIQIIKALEETE